MRWLLDAVLSALMILDTADSTFPRCRKVTFRKDHDGSKVSQRSRWFQGYISQALLSPLLCPLYRRIVLFCSVRIVHDDHRRARDDHLWPATCSRSHLGSIARDPLCGQDEEHPKVGTEHPKASFAKQPETMRSSQSFQKPRCDARCGQKLNVEKDKQESRGKSTQPEANAPSLKPMHPAC